MDANAWKMLWKKGAKEKIRMKGCRVGCKYETRSWKTCIVDFALLTS